jgi:hypothetical protein
MLIRRKCRAGFEHALLGYKRIGNPSVGVKNKWHIALFFAAAAMPAESGVGS